MERLWNGCGTVVERLWNGCGTAVERWWNGCGTVVERLWNGCGADGRTSTVTMCGWRLAVITVTSFLMASTTLPLIFLGSSTAKQSQVQWASDGGFRFPGGESLDSE